MLRTESGYENGPPSQYTGVAHNGQSSFGGSYKFSHACPQSHISQEVTASPQAARALRATPQTQSENPPPTTSPGVTQNPLASPPASPRSGQLGVTKITIGTPSIYDYSYDDLENGVPSEFLDGESIGTELPPFEPQSVRWAVVKGLGAGSLQALLNGLNGLQDIAFGLVNLKIRSHPLSHFGDFEIPSPDWSRGLIVHEPGEQGTWGDSHAWSKALVSDGMFTLATLGAGKVLRLLDKGADVARPVEAGTGVIDNLGVIDDAHYAQRTFKSTFAVKEGPLAGKTIDEVADMLKTGKLKPSDLPIEYGVIDSRALILNTRSAQALTRAGIPRNQWLVHNITDDAEAMKRLWGQLDRNKLTTDGVREAIESGTKK